MKYFKYITFNFHKKEEYCSIIGKSIHPVALNPINYRSMKKFDNHEISMWKYNEHISRSSIYDFKDIRVKMLIG